jgi:microcystin degradation protein MlrC
MRAACQPALLSSTRCGCVQLPTSEGYEDMRIFTAAVATETNTYAAVPTGWSDYEAYGIYRGDGSIKDADGMGAFTKELRRLATADGHEIVESLCAFSQPSGRTLAEVWQNFRSIILEDLRAAMPVQAVVLFLHGAMAAEDCDDCEGDLLRHIRAIVGPEVAIGAELDLHCHFTESMRASADVIIACKEYPHTDFIDREAELYRIVLDCAAGRVQPVTAVHDCRMIGIWPTTREPMAEFVRRMKRLEGSDGVLSISLGHGFPWADVTDVGARLWVVTDNDPAKAEMLARQLGREFWELREQIGNPYLSVEAALARAGEVHDGLVVAADAADNAGGGASSESTFILRAMVEAGTRDAAIGAFWDLGAVHLCKSAGVGAVLDLRIGGKCGPASGRPVDLRVTVRTIIDNYSQKTAGGDHGGGISPMGTAVWVRAENGLDLLLNTQRTQIFSPSAFTGIGIPLAEKKLVVVKSANHFLASYACEILFVDTPGALTVDFATIPYTRRDGNYWPRVANPHG